MMKFSHTLLILITTASILTSCKVDFPLDVLDADPIMYLDALTYYDNDPAKSANVDIYIYAVPPTGDRTPLKGSRCNIRTYLNDTQIDNYKDIELEPFSGLTVSHLEDANPGDKVTVVAEGEGFSSIMAETTIPQTPKMPEIYYRKINDNLVNLRIILSDNPDTEDCYALTFYQFLGEKPSFDTIGNNASLAFGSPADMGVAGTGPFDVAWKDFGSQIYYGLSDTSFKGNSKSLELNLKLDHKDGYDSYFRVSLLSVSKEKLKYEIARYDKSSNILGSFGLAPITYAYTNVRGGAGYLGSQNSIKSEWFNADSEN